ncbi:MAG: cytochrome c3 family protein, partial [Deltaproteobacteria bacterium]|nr:cytochrome c3 family protein [Deltaproteobacteria bacterium]
MSHFGIRFPLLTLVALLCQLPANRAVADDAVVFNHGKHIEEGAECGDCHDLDSNAVLPPFKRDACTDCHDEEAPARWRLPAKARRLKIRFPHRTHAESLECVDCHQRTLDGTQLAGQPVVTRAGCIKCHEENDVAVPERKCAACHGFDRRNQPPADHGQAWLKRHGRESRWRSFGGHGRSCTL